MNNKCPKGKILNPKTGRCVNKDGKIGQEILKNKKDGKPKKECKSYQILNPKTGRCVNKDGKLGQEILKNKKDDKVKKDGKPKKECKSYQIPNPKTGRCVNKDGKLGQEILLRDGKIATPVGPGIPDNFKKLPDDCELNKVWKTKSKIGSGKYGTAYITCKDDDDCNYVLKVQDLTNDFYTEVSCLEDLKNTKNIVPKIYAAWTCDNNGYFVIEKLDKCPYDKFNRDKDTYKEVSNLLKKLKEKGWLHVDTHYGNIMCKNGKFILIDFGWAVKKGQKTYPDNPLSIKLGEPLTFRDLELAQEKNKEDFFGYSKYKIRMATRKWDNRKLD
jgi:hypothetical protein